MEHKKYAFSFLFNNHEIEGTITAKNSQDAMDSLEDALYHLIHIGEGTLAVHGLAVEEGGLE